jgi:hypothetical protein
MMRLTLLEYIAQQLNLATKVFGTVVEESRNQLVSVY